MKFFLLAICFVAAFGAVAPRKSDWLGSTDGDLVLLFARHVEDPFTNGQKKTTELIYSGERAIAAINIENFIENGAEYEVFAGGIGSNHATIRLTDNGSGMNTVVEIFGLR